MTGARSKGHSSFLRGRTTVRSVRSDSLDGVRQVMATVVEMALARTAGSKRSSSSVPPDLERRMMMSLEPTAPCIT